MCLRAAGGLLGTHQAPCLKTGGDGVLRNAGACCRPCPNCPKPAPNNPAEALTAVACPYGLPRLDSSHHNATAPRPSRTRMASFSSASTAALSSKSAKYGCASASFAYAMQAVHVNTSLTLRVF